MCGAFSFWSNFTCSNSTASKWVPTLFCAAAAAANYFALQECIPVGCIPAATVAVCWGVPAREGSCWMGDVCSRGSAPGGMPGFGEGWYPSMH